MNEINILVPDLPESISDATVVKWHKKIGEKVNCDDNIVDIETDKVMLEISSPCDGILKTILEEEGKIVKSQQILGKIKKFDFLNKNIPSKTENNSLEFIQNVKKQKEKEYSLEYHGQYCTPSIRRLIKSHQINNDPLNKKIVIDKTIDFKNIIEEKQNKKNKNLLSPNILYSNENIKKEKKYLTHRVKMTRLQQRMAERLLDSKKNTAMLTTFNEVNMKQIILLRKKYGEDFKKKHGIRIGFMSFFIKAVVEGLKKFPQINAYIDKDDIVFFKNFDISIAISTPKGLITPVLRNVENMTMPEIEKKIKEFSMKGFQNKINIEELIGGNFTITNGGVFGSLLSTPIINPPQTAILGMHVIQDRPVVINNEIKILPMMYLALSYDHRLIDGKESVGFLITVKNILEDFTRILIDI